MGWPNIPLHAPYHPDRRKGDHPYGTRSDVKNVRRDEASHKKAEQDGKIALADAKSQLLLPREHGLHGGINGKGKGKANKGTVSASAGLSPGTGTGSGKHTNSFEDLEQQAMSAVKEAAPSEAKRGISLIPSAKSFRKTVRAGKTRKGFGRKKRDIE